MSTAARILLTSRLVLVPTTLAISLPSYVEFFGGLISDGRITGMGWADANPKAVSPGECVEILKMKNRTTWGLRGFGYFGAAELPGVLKDRVPSQLGGYVELGARVLGADELQSLSWVGYGCIRDATQPRVLTQRQEYLQSHAEPPPTAYDGELPPWQEMVEIKYGFHPSQWGRGLATEVVDALHKWGIARFSIRRFIGVTLKVTLDLAVLQKVGYVAYDKQLWWSYEDDDEWVLHVKK